MHSIHLQSKIIILLLVCVCTLPLHPSPRLTVVVAVDGMSQSDLNMLRTYWQQGGLRTLSEEAYQTQVTFPHQVYGGDETLATMLTGVTPDQHSLCMDYYYNRRDRKVYPTLKDDNYTGIGTSVPYSPQAVLTPTMSDRLRMAEGDDAAIYAIGLHPSTTIVLAGHAANACCWLQQNEEDGHWQWASTSFYHDGLPAAADEMNMNGHINELASRTWMPRMDIAMYNRPSAEERKAKGFSISQQSCLTSTPAGNTLVIELALALQEKKNLGKNAIPDMLLLELTVSSPHATADRIQTAEQEDMYLWLNQDLGYLMEQLDRRIGHTNYNILVVGLPRLGADASRLADINMPVRNFNVEQAAALTNTYLMAIYGHERWVDGGFGQSIYLNRTLIEQKHQSLANIQQQVADFLMEFTGIHTAFPASAAYLNPSLATSMHKRYIGDVIFRLESGCQLTHTSYVNGHEQDSPIDRILDEQPSTPVLYWSGTHFTFPQSDINATDILRLVLP